MLAWKHWKTKSFLPLINNRFLIIISEYHYWHWNRPAGKSKTKNKIFYFAGIYNIWKDKRGEF